MAPATAARRAPRGAPSDPSWTRALPGIDAHPHARAVLAPALRAGAPASHAYLFHGAARRRQARRSRARLPRRCSSDDAAARPSVARERIARGTHPDMTWVTPIGRGGNARRRHRGAGRRRAPRARRSSRARRVFVIEARRHDERPGRQPHAQDARGTARLRAPAAADRSPRGRARRRSPPRCQPVRFDPLPPSRIAARLGGVERDRAQACARLA